jgi:peptide/nickel transport system substrate-binding protein
MSNKLFLRIAAVSTLAIWLAACGRSNEGEGKAIFRYNESAGISTLDPAFAKDQALIWATSQIFNGLVRLDSNLNVEPCIAKRWSVSSDGLTYTFTLRDDVYFHKNPLFKTSDSTRRVVAADFLYSLGRILDPDVASPGLWIFTNVADNGFEAPDDTTFVVRLKEPFAPMLSLLSMPYCSVVPREVVEHYGTDFRNHPVGTGPFRFQYWKEGVKLVLRRNDNYFERDAEGHPLPYLDAVAVTFIIDKQTVFLEFVKGNLDFMNSLDASYKDEILTRTGQLKSKYASRIDMVSIPFLNTEYLGFNMETFQKDFSEITGKPLDAHKCKLIRQAINYGFDREKMMKYMRNNVGKPGLNGMIPCGLPAYDSSAAYGYGYNPARARELLAEAGFPNGNGLPPIKLATTSSYLDLCKYIQQQLSLIGIDIKLDVNPPAALREQMAQGKSPWFRGSWIADYPDAENYMTLFYSPNHSPAGPNYTHFTSQRFDRLYRAAIRETDNAKRLRMYREMDSLVMDEAPVIVLYYDQILHFTHKNISGMRTNAMNALDLRFTKKEQTKTAGN